MARVKVPRVTRLSHQQCLSQEGESKLTMAQNVYYLQQLVHLYWDRCGMRAFPLLIHQPPSPARSRPSVVKPLNCMSHSWVARRCASRCSRHHARGVVVQVWHALRGGGAPARLARVVHCVPTVGAGVLKKDLPRQPCATLDLAVREDFELLDESEQGDANKRGH